MSVRRACARACLVALTVALASCAGRAAEPRTLRVPSDDDVVSVQIAVRAGSVDDPPGKEGLTHLALHLAREGGAGELDAFGVREALFALAAELEVHVDREVSVIALRVHRDVLDEALAVLDATLVSPRLDVRAFDRLRRDALDAIRNALRGTEEEWLAEEALHALVYAGHPYGHPVIGTEAGLSAIALEDVRAQLARVLCASRVVVGVTGRAPVGLEATLAARFARSASCARAPSLPEPSLHGPHVWIVDHPAARAATVRMLAPHAVTRADRDHAALVLFAGYVGLSGQFLGRLMQQVREARGLNYGDYAYAEHVEPSYVSRGPAAHAVRRQQGFEIVLRPMEPEHVAFVTRLVFRELHLALTTLPEDGVRSVAGFLDGYLPLWLETADARLGSALDQSFFGRTASYVDELRGAFPTLDAASVQAAARRHVDPTALRFVVVTPEAEALREALLAPRVDGPAYEHRVTEAVRADDAVIASFPLALEPEDVVVVDVGALFAR